MSEQILTEEAWKERCRLLVLENDELMAENEQLTKYGKLLETLLKITNPEALEELNHE